MRKRAFLFPNVLGTASELSIKHPESSYTVY